MIDEDANVVDSFAVLRERASAAHAAFAKEATAIFERLSEVDPDLSALAVELFGTRSAAALAFAQGGFYDDLGAGQREEVRARILRVSHGIF